MLRSAFLFICIVFAVFTFPSCNGLCVRPHGEQTTQERPIAAFDAVKANSFSEIEIVYSESPFLTISAPSDVIDYLVTEVVEGKLIIRVKNNKCFKGNYIAKITAGARSIKSVSNSGSGILTIQKMKPTETFDATLSGSGNLSAYTEAKNANIKVAGSGSVSLRGTVDKINAEVNGSGNIYAIDEFASRVALAEVAGSGNIEIAVSEQLEANVAGSGNVFYRGTPTVRSRVTGSGRVQGGR